jgi:ribonuclease HI
MYSSSMATIIFTDGSSRGNPGPGGWGALLISSEEKNSRVAELGGREDHTTNNRMELMAALRALEYAEERKLPAPIEIRTDSAYLLNGITMWVFGWEKNGWKTKEGEPVQNQDIWQELAPLSYRLKKLTDLTWKKVAGHAGDLGNERVDEIATSYADGGHPLLFSGPKSEYERLFGDMLEPALYSSPKNRKNAIAYSYVSSINGEVFAHKTWPECESRVKGKKGAKYKKVFSKEEEEALVSEWAKK